MKSSLLVLCLLGFWLPLAQAELQFPDIERFPLAAQQAWGYTVKVNKGANPSLGITLSPVAAKAFESAILFVRDEQKRTLAEFQVGTSLAPDGTLSLHVRLSEILRGSAELVISSSPIEGAVIVPNFGGFTFHLSSPHP